MKKRKDLRSFLLIVFGVLTLLGWPKLSYADWQNHAGHHGTHPYYHYHDHPHWGLHVSAFYPDEYFPVWAGGTRYYYDDGIYYSYSDGVYVVASPPIGAVVSAIPSDFQPVVINGATYYSSNGTFYVYTPSGYKVVSPPQVQAVTEATGIPDTYIVNVPNDRGGYVTITLRKSGNGFVGPQGEFYATFPNVPQLKVMYGK